jgi:ribosome-interacting GTPase 1
MDLMMRELRAMDINVNRPKPRMHINHVDKNIGIIVELNKSGLPDMDVEEVLREFKEHNVIVRIEDKMNIDELISMVAGRAIYMKGLIVLNKIDRRVRQDSVPREMEQKWNMRVVPVSAKIGTNIDRLKAAIYDNLDIMTVYLAPEGDKEYSMILERGSTVADAAKKLHTKLIDIMKSAYITGPSAKFEKQKVGSGHVLKEGDRITFIRGDK